MKIDLYQVKVSGLDYNFTLVLKHDGVCLVGFGEQFYPPKLRLYVWKPVPASGSTLQNLDVCFRYVTCEVVAS